MQSSRSRRQLLHQPAHPPLVRCRQMTHPMPCGLHCESHKISEISKTVRGINNGLWSSENNSQLLPAITTSSEAPFSLLDCARLAQHISLSNHCPDTIKAGSKYQSLHTRASIVHELAEACSPKASTQTAPTVSRAKLSSSSCRSLASNVALSGVHWSACWTFGACWSGNAPLCMRLQPILGPACNVMISIRSRLHMQMCIYLQRAEWCQLTALGNLTSEASLSIA